MSDPSKTALTDWEVEVYRQGSDACRNYSGLTMRTRTLSQQILAVAVVGLATAAVKGADVPGILLFGGVTLLAFAFSLLFVDWHYQSAFTAIRNTLASMESKRGMVGPWLCHLNARTHFNDHLASYSPFVALATLGCLSVWRGLAENAIKPFSEGKSVWLIPLIAFTAILAFFLNRCRHAKKRDADMKKIVDAELRKHGLELDEPKHLCLLKQIDSKMLRNEDSEAVR